MKKGFTILLTVAMMVGMNSCKKDKIDSASKGKVKSMIFGNGPDADYFGYDSEGRLAWHYSDIDMDTFKYSYTASTVTVTDKDGPFTYNLNSQGLATSGPLGFIATYNSNGNILTHNRFAGTTIEFTWANGNMTGFVGLDNLYEYYADIDNRNDLIGLPNYVSGYTTGFNVGAFLGKTSKNLLKSYKVSGSLVGSWVYEFDADKRVVKMIETDHLNGTNSTFTFTYY